MQALRLKHYRDRSGASFEMANWIAERATLHPLCGDEDEARSPGEFWPARGMADSSGCGEAAACDGPDTNCQKAIFGFASDLPGGILLLSRARCPCLCRPA